MAALGWNQGCQMAKAHLLLTPGPLVPSGRIPAHWLVHTRNHRFLSLCHWLLCSTSYQVSLPGVHLHLGRALAKLLAFTSLSINLPPTPSSGTASRKALDSAAPTWAPWVEKKNEFAQLPVTAFAERGNPGTQQVAANDGTGRAGEADGHCVFRLSLLYCCPGISPLRLQL